MDTNKITEVNKEEKGNIRHHLDIQKGIIEKRGDVLYMGAFVDEQDSLRLPTVLSKKVQDQHVTYSFMPSVEQAEKIGAYMGKKVKFTVIGYGNDGVNEGLLVKPNIDIPYYGQKNMHITLSLAENGKAVKTGSLTFDQPIPENMPTEIEATIGLMLPSKTVVIPHNTDIDNVQNIDEIDSSNEKNEETKDNEQEFN